MGSYLIGKYWKGALTLILVFIFSLYTFDTFDEAMTGTVCFFCLGWVIKFFISFDKNPQKATMMLGGLFGLLKLFWYVVTLKPLRRWLLRLWYVGISPKPYPYLALYGSLLDTHVIKYKMSAAFYRDKTPVVRAALWRLLARGAIQLSNDEKGKAAIKLHNWSDSPSDGLDQDLERSLYNFLSESTQTYGIIKPHEVQKVMRHYDNNNTRSDDQPDSSGKTGKNYDKENQFRFADLLNTGISLKAYRQRDVQNIFGMKRFLKGLPKTYTNYVEREPANRTTTGSQLPELHLVWKEYMAYAYLFGIEEKTLRHISRMINADNPEYQLLQQLTSSREQRNALKKLMDGVSRATPAVEDAVAGHLGLMPIAWHNEEVYDL